MILTLIKLVGVASTMVLAWRIAISDEMIFEKIGQWGERKVKEGHKIYDLIVCPFCCGSIMAMPAFGVAYAFGIIQLSWMLLLLYPLTVFGTSIVAGFTWVGYTAINAWKEKLEVEKKYLEKVEEMEYLNIKDRKEAYNRKNNIQPKERHY